MWSEELSENGYDDSEDSYDSESGSVVSNEGSIEQGTEYEMDSGEGFPLFPDIPIEDRKLTIRYMKFIRWLNAYLYNLQHTKPVTQDEVEAEAAGIGSKFNKYLHDISVITKHVDVPEKDELEDLFEDLSLAIAQCMNTFTDMVEDIMEIDIELHNKKVKQPYNRLFKKKGLDQMNKLKKKRRAWREKSQELMALMVEAFYELANAALEKVIQSGKPETWISDLFEEFMPRFRKVSETLKKEFFDIRVNFA